ncbi:MAG: GDP-6-deoxy-D-mannose reductase [Promethearchaeota archaeon]|nr:MAG: GDP-6-deoxy-D-mannose reductase [Candidatus Lokiarchaeota archaeon]
MIRPDFIFHFGTQPYVIPSWVDPWYTINTNVIGTINVFEPLKEHGIKSRVIVACSSAEYGTTTDKVKRPLKESDPLKAVHPYGISKIATELLDQQYFLNFEIDTVNLRFFNQTGPRKINDACSDFVRKVVQIELGLAEPVIEVGNLSPYRDITGVRDSLSEIWLSATKGVLGETYNVCSNRKIQIRDILEITMSFSSKTIEVKENTPEKLRKTDEDIILGDNTKIINELGFKIIQSIEDLLGEMFEYWMDYYKK